MNCILDRRFNNHHSLPFLIRDKISEYRMLWVRGRFRWWNEVFNILKSFLNLRLWHTVIRYFGIEYSIPEVCTLFRQSPVKHNTTTATKPAPGIAQHSVCLRSTADCGQGIPIFFISKTSIPLTSPWPVTTCVQRLKSTVVKVSKL